MREFLVAEYEVYDLITTLCCAMRGCNLTFVDSRCKLSNALISKYRLSLASILLYHVATLLGSDP
jgi:hypothetical protein